MAADQSGIVGCQRGFAEGPAGLAHELAQRQARGNESTEQGVQIGHQHGRGDAFARHVSEHEIEAARAGIYHVAVVAADQAGWLVLIGNLPPADKKIWFGQ